MILDVSSVVYWVEVRVMIVQFELLLWVAKKNNLASGMQWNL